MRTLILFAALLFLISASNSDTNILWSAGYKLKWSDFKGKPSPANANERSATKTRIELTTQSTQTKFVFKVLCFFETEKSWTTVDTGAGLLEHEQGHFDIAEVYARKLREQLAGLKNSPKLKEDLKTMYHKVITECVAYQVQYDTETDHSKDTEKQAQWHKKVKSLLKGSEAFNVSQVTISR